jgi:alpha-beta hydrolase superfamily lysophospholipase
MAWQPTSVIEDIPELDLSKGAAIMSPQLKAYQVYYGLNFENYYPCVEHLIGFIHMDDFNIATHVFRLPNAKGTVFLQHGYYDHVGIYGNIIKHCLQQEFNVFCYDLPGHGLASGERGGIDSFDQYDRLFCQGLALIQKNLPAPIVAIGQSTGGAIIVNYLLTRGLTRDTSPFANVYLLAPLVRPTNWSLSVLYYYISKPFIRQMKRTFSNNSNNSDFLAFLKNHDPLQPLYLKINWVAALHRWIKKIERIASVDLDVHVIQGTDDGTVDAKHNIKILENKFSGFDVTYIQDARHQLVNENPAKLSQVLARLGSLV